MTKRTALYLLFRYPSYTEAFIESEIRAVQDEYNIAIIATLPRSLELYYYKEHQPYQEISDEKKMLELIQETRPTVIHAHRLFMLPLIERLCLQTNIPFTIRSHAHDAVLSTDPRVSEWMSVAPTILPRATNSDLCLGIIAFPFTRVGLEAWGVPSQKIYDCWPVVDFHRFYDVSPNGEDVINTGSFMPKKKMEDFIELARMLPNMTFNLYALPSRLYTLDTLRQIKQTLNSPVNIMNPVDPSTMPKVYKRHRWMVYSGDSTMKTVGWPVSIAEAQAAGVGVCMANIRPDIKQYIGDAGFIYNSLTEVKDIISQPFPEELRRKGFEQARKSDIFKHKNILLSLWDSV